MSTRVERDVDVVVVGAGPSGLAAAAELARLGVGRVEVLDREAEAGGVPRHCDHTGFGLRDLHRVLTGPAYSRVVVDRAVAAGAVVRTGVSVTGWAGPDDHRPLGLETTSAEGLELLRPRVVVLATGARERPRPARWLPGDRPAGVMTTGELQRTVHGTGLPVGRRAVVVGAEHVAYSAVVTLAHAGVEVVAMVTSLPRHQSYAAFHLAAAARYRFPLLTGTVVTRIGGRGRVGEVDLRAPDGTLTTVRCDTVVLTGDWVADHELARSAGVAVDGHSGGVVVDTAGRTSVPGLLAVGNAVHPVLTADLAALAGRAVAGAAVAVLRGRPASPPSVGFALGDPLAWVAPARIPADLCPPPRGRFVLWPTEVVRFPSVEVRQAGRLLWAGRSTRTMAPGRPLDVPGGWVRDVAVPGPDVAVTVR